MKVPLFFFNESNKYLSNYSDDELGYSDQSAEIERKKNYT